MTRKTLTTILEVLGLVLVVAGIGTIWGTGAVLIAGGLGLVAIGFLEGN